MPKLLNGAILKLQKQMVHLKFLFNLVKSNRVKSLLCLVKMEQVKQLLSRCSLVFLNLMMRLLKCQNLM